MSRIIYELLAATVVAISVFAWAFNNPREMLQNIAVVYSVIFFVLMLFVFYLGDWGRHHRVIIKFGVSLVWFVFTIGLFFLMAQG